jgi:hypothetical protein
VKAGLDLNAVYKQTMAPDAPEVRPLGDLQHCMPFDVTRCYDE